MRENIGNNKEGKKIIHEAVSEARSQWGVKKFKLLDILAVQAMNLADLHTVLLTDPMATTGIRSLERALRKAERQRERAGQKQEEKNKFYSFIYLLKRDGFIKKEGFGYAITKKGLEWYTKFKKRLLPDFHYPVEKSNEVTIITFDVPEKERRKRDWLRSALKSLSFQMMHKSVWLGNVQLPKSFLEDLHKLNLINCVHIVSVTKQGTLKNLLQRKI